MSMNKLTKAYFIPKISKEKFMQNKFNKTTIDGFRKTDKDLTYKITEMKIPSHSIFQSSKKVTFFNQAIDKTILTEVSHK